MGFQEIIIRLGLAILVGGLIGYEREFKNRPAGFRTHILVCIGAAVISMIQMHMVEQTSNIILMQPEMSDVFKIDLGRLGAQVITGVGFLGAGTIIHQKGSVKGLTTAASLWTVACIGLAIGMGYYSLSIVAAIAIFLVLVSLKGVENRFFERGKIISIEIQYHDKEPLMEKIQIYFNQQNIRVKQIDFSLEEEKVAYTIVLPRYIEENRVAQDLGMYEEVDKVMLM